MVLSVYPEYRVDPSADQAREMHSGFIAFLPISGSSGTSSATVCLLSRSQILMAVPVAAHSQYLEGGGVLLCCGKKMNVESSDVFVVGTKLFHILSFLNEKKVKRWELKKKWSYLLGEKLSSWMTSDPSSEYRCSPCDGDGGVGV